MKKNGFTLVELITVVILLGILSAVALPRFFDTNTFNDAFDRNDLESALSWSRNRAVTAQCAHELRITNTEWSVFKDTNCDSTTTEPACSTGVTFHFANTATTINNDVLTGTSPITVAASTNLRFIFTAGGQVFEPNNLPNIDACTTLNSTPIATNSSYTLSTGTLSVDGNTAYVDVQ